MSPLFSIGTEKQVTRLLELEARVAQLRSLLDSELANPTRIGAGTVKASQNTVEDGEAPQAEDIRTALAGAEGDLSYEKVISAHKTIATERTYKLVSAIIIPLIVVAFTAIAGNWLASSFQARDFRTNSVHQYKLDTLKRGRDESIKLLSDAQLLKELASAFELWGGGYSWYGPLKTLSDNLERVRTLGHGIVDETESDRVFAFSRQQIAALQSCLQVRKPDAGNACTKNFDESGFRKIADFFSLQLLSLHKKDV